MRQEMQMIDLCSGIAGFSLAGKWMGWETIQFCEINKFCQKIIAHHFPDVPIHDDLKTLNYEKIKARIDPKRPVIIVGGIPCQPFSHAGKRLGTADPRHLWPYFIEAVRSVQPDFCVVENVGGFINWNGGMVFEQVQADLENEGYEVQAYVLPACGVNAPHRRDRVWFIAVNTKCQCNGRHNSGESGGKGVDLVRNILDSTGRNESADNTKSPSIDAAHTANTRVKGLRREGENSIHKSKPFADTERIGQSGSRGAEGCFSTTPNENWKASWSYDDGRWPTQSPVCGRNDGVSYQLDASAIFDRVCKPAHAKTWAKWRQESITALGNAIVPQVAFEIFKAIAAI